MARDRVKVLMIGPDRLVHGGISAVVNNYYEADLDKKVELRYIGTMKEGGKLKKLLVAIGAYIKFSRLLPDYDIVHVNASSDSSILRKAFFIKLAKKKGKKVILHQHGGDFRRYYEVQITENRRRFIKNILDMADVMLVLTRSWKQYFGKLTDESKIIIFPNCLSVEAQKNNKEKVLEKRENLNKLLFLGRICKDKGIDELLDAVSELNSEGKKVQLFLGGIFEDENYRKRVEKMGEQVKFLGWIFGKEKEQYLDSCGIFVLPSYYEGFPVSVLEAMSHGCVVVASRVGGIPDIVEDGRDGVLMPAKDVSALKNAIIRVMDNPEFADELKVRAYKKVVDLYSIDECIEKLVNIYNSMLGC